MTRILWVQDRSLPDLSNPVDPTGLQKAVVCPTVYAVKHMKEPLPRVVE